MAPQVTRLAICFLALFVLFFALHTVTVPPNFGTDGWHRQEAPKILASRAPIHAGKQACMQCHEDKFQTTPHVKAGLSCETCHGPAEAHVLDTDNVKPFLPSTRDFCIRCHGQVVGRPASQPQVDSKTHNPGQLCIECHEIHPKEGQK